jgi:hypothetical protein
MNQESSFFSGDMFYFWIVSGVTQGRSPAPARDHRQNKENRLYQMMTLIS